MAMIKQLRNSLNGLLICYFLITTTASCKYDYLTLHHFLKFTEGLLHETIDFQESSSPGPRDCYEILKKGHKDSGIYRIWPSNWRTFGSFNVFCDMQTDGGGWTIIQRRGNYGQPKDYFYKNWQEYKMGFGHLHQDFWLGNDKVFSLTNQGNYSLRINMKDKEGEKRHALYKNFWIENESQLYLLHASDYSGDAGDSLSNGNEMRFSTKDKDNDHSENSCAVQFKGAWWYQSCHLSNLNGLYHDGPHESFADGVNWKTWKGYNYSLRDIEMKIRPLKQ